MTRRPANIRLAGGNGGTMLAPPARPLLFAAASAAVYLALALVAYLHFPGPYSPLHDWLSDLGNRKLNPAGAIYYRAGSEAGGALIAAFFFSLGRWHGGKTVVGWALRTMQLLGMVAGFAFLATGIFPNDAGKAHDVSAFVLFGSFSTALVVSLIAFPVRRNRHGIMVPMAVFCWCSVVADAFAQVRLLEWTTLGGFLAYTLLLGALLRRASPRFR